MRTIRAALCNPSVLCGGALGTLHLGTWWVYRLCAGTLPGDVRVSWQTGCFQAIALGIAFLYLGEHDLLGSAWKTLVGISFGGFLPVLLAWLAGC